MKRITTIGIDLAKNSFTVYGVNAKGKPVLQRTLSRSGVIRFFANLSACFVGCGYGGMRFFGILGKKYRESGA